MSRVSHVMRWSGDGALGAVRLEWVPHARTARLDVGLVTLLPSRAELLELAAVAQQAASYMQDDEPVAVAIRSSIQINVNADGLSAMVDESDAEEG